MGHKNMVGHASNSFTLDELKALEMACKSLLLARGTIDAVTKSPAFSRAYAKIMRMKDKAASTPEEASST